ncbi:MAG: HNH endonuclease, partial [Planctomycetes bacterium]|nr:HNH endonuclease [Planctomycetota bacterium]
MKALTHIDAKGRTDAFRVLKCEYCELIISGRIRRERRFCSRHCAGRAGRPKLVNYICAFCKQQFSRPASWGIIKYCSHSCHQSDRWKHVVRLSPPNERQCAKCKTTFAATREHFGPTKGGRGGLKSECRACSRLRHTQWNKTRVVTSAQRERARLLARIHAQNRRSKLVGSGHGIRHGVENIKRLWKEQDGCCAYCNNRLDKYHIDHIIPLARGGKHLPENWCLSCPDCNYKK